ncbi:MAG: hypothetical protein WCG15_06595 [Actinomycetes bacterium]
MPSPNATPTPITPPRVPLIDPRTGLIDRAWYLFFLSLNNIASGVVDDGGTGADAISLLASYDQALMSVNQELQTLPPTADLSAELIKQIQEANLVDCCSALVSQFAEMQKQIEALNLLPPPAQGTVTAVTATAPVVSSGGTVPDISMPAASTSVSGYLTSTDWNTFNSKAPATSGTSILYGNGTGGFSNVTIGSGVSFAAGTLSATGSGGTVTSVTGTAPVVSSGGTTPAISMAAASSSTNGYLTSTDWTTFNNKGSGTVTSASVVSANGFAGTVATATTTPAITLTTTITGLLKGNGTAISAATANTDYMGVAAPVTKTADFTVANGEIWYINNKSGSTCTVTLPAASSWTGRTLTFKNMQAQTLVSASSNVVPIDSTSAGTAILLAVVGNWATMVSDGTNWVIMQQAANNCLLLE